ncbi:unnamed protein product [Bursaphelenchus xylophilus]|uniref:(pine wood nematode) hypothetical protein n=1 Tax=Bursaphelenchus xylophilus TaxID=6326 RepID=A0A1I7SGY5_BURXY|nr:unnamed protein product [Bursaphelenchus xylophilus]CAG9104616.1 unnamed protein product [Bursaphelenchus xylophilus]
MSKVRDVGSNGNKGSTEGIEEGSIRLWTPIFPVLCCVCGLIAMFAGYLTAVLNHHIDAWLPLISEGGVFFPESGIFASFFNLTAFFWWITSFLICLQLHQHIRVHRGAHSKLRFVVYFMLATGLISGVGLVLLANFRLNSPGSVHGKGALALFFGGMAFSWCYIVMMAVLKQQPKWVWIGKVVLISIVSACVILHETGKRVPFLVTPFPNGTYPAWPQHINGVFRVDSDNPFFTHRVVTNAAEWALAIGYFLIVASSAYDLTFLRLQFEVKQRVSMIENLDPGTMVGVPTISRYNRKIEISDVAD